MYSSFLREKRVYAIANTVLQDIPGKADEDQGCVLTSLLLKVLRLTRVWNAGMGQS